MFGYIKPYEDELKVRDFKLYRALYCGLCKSAGKQISLFSRLFLNYDYTLFAAVRMIFNNTDYTVKESRCFLRPFSKTTIVSDNSDTALAAATFSVLTYHKLADDIKDENFIKSLGARILLPLAWHMSKKAKKNGFSDVNLIAEEYIEKLSQAEQNPNTDIFEASEIFGEMLGYILKLGLPEDEAQNAFTVGFEIGRFIYIADAIDDIFKDEKSGSFNPLLNTFKNGNQAVCQAEQQLNLFLHGTDSAADIISGKKLSLGKKGVALCEIVQNVLYLGCPATLKDIIRKQKNHGSNNSKGIDI